MSDKYAALRAAKPYELRFSRLWERYDEACHGNAEHMRDILELTLDALETAERRIANSDRDVLALLAERDADRARIAELEARTLSVKLPQGYVIREGHPINEGERHVMVPKDGGDWLSSFDVELALLKAGISLKIEGE